MMKKKESDELNSAPVAGEKLDGSPSKSQAESHSAEKTVDVNSETNDLSAHQKELSEAGSSNNQKLEMKTKASVKQVLNPDEKSVKRLKLAGKRSNPSNKEKRKSGDRPSVSDEPVKKKSKKASGSKDSTSFKRNTRSGSK